ncbi:hypothetical protein PsYK624_014650 [Phanerochaete sordida]|uniref:Uncharacterized protein n=1 Tax=Phanerochaete sordida TaxID=48140 RepID=A0A9P3FZC0_9APHY|nr:hypothetical protein PsYK624_014650 [Phanerochaete sordida]
MSTLTPAEVERQIRAVYEEGNMRSLAQELVHLRASHRAQGSDIVALKQQLLQMTAEKLQVQSDLRHMSRLKAQLDTELNRSKSKCGRLEKELATMGDDSLERRIQCLERQAALAERLAEVRKDSM